MKKTISILCIVMMLACVIAGCGNGTNDNSENNTSAGTIEETDSNTEEKTDSDSDNITDDSQNESENESDLPEDSRTLVVYYSASGTTETVAETIAETAAADIFEIIPTEIYTNDDLDWRDSDSRVSIEHADESLRAVELVSTEVPDWDEYDTIFIGYPIWWGIAAWPVDGFVQANDFTGKTVIPFCTSTSSGLGESGTLLAEQAGTGNWQEGIRFQSSVSSEEVVSWTNEILDN